MQKLMSLFGSGKDYSYAYGVVCGKGSKLFTTKQLENLAMYKSVSEIVTFLNGTDYEKDISEAVGKAVDPEKLENAVLKHFLRIYKEISASLPAADKLTLEKMTFGYIEITNLEILLRLIHAGASDEEKRKAISEEVKWDGKESHELIGSKTVRELIQKLEGTKFHRNLESAVDDYEKTGSLIPLEMELERILAKDWLELKGRISEDLASYIAKNIDVMNILFSLRLQDFGSEKGKYFIEGGKYVSRKMYLDMLKAKEPEKIHDVIKNTPFSAPFAEGIERFEKTGSLVGLEILLNRVILKRFANDALFRPLSMSTIILFIARKRFEIKNLKRIIACKAAGISPDEIKELLM